MVALLITALLGFTGLAVDGSGTMAKQQELQNGADAAALAAAMECGKNDTCAGIDVTAGPYGVENVSKEKGTVTTVLTPNSLTRTVRAQVTGTKTHWFLPVLGLSSSTLDAEATATWGTPRTGPTMLPLTVSMCSFERAVDTPDLDVIKDIYMPKNGSEDGPCYWGGTYPPGSFGWLTNSCTSLPVIGVDTWVSSDPGANEPSACDWPSMVGEIVLIPIFDDRRPGPPKEVHIEKFAALELLGITPSNGSSPFGQACSYTAPAYENARFHKTCIRGKFLNYVTSLDDYLVDGEDSEVTLVRLVD